MSIARATGSALVNAPARVVYSLIADYRGSHPRMLPAQYFPRRRVYQEQLALLSTIAQGERISR